MAAKPLLEHLEEATDLPREGAAGLFLDIDGTLSRIVPVPHEATVSPSIRQAVAALASRLALVSVLTGRPAADGREMVGLEGLTYVGNHGMEWIEDGQAFTDPAAAPHEERVRRALEAVRARCASTDAIIEEKVASFAVHYRGSRDPEMVRRLALQAIEEQGAGEVMALDGKAHLNVLPPVALSKGTALRTLAVRHGLDWALVAGDDVTDIDAFREARALAGASAFRCVNVAVLGEGCPQALLELADYTLASVGEMERFLTWWAGNLRRQAT